jgi:hypothetical protein
MTETELPPPVSDDEHMSLLYVTHAYSCRRQVQDEIEQAKEDGLLRSFTKTDPEHDQFWCPGAPVTEELSKSSIGVKERYVWCKDAHLQFPASRAQLDHGTTLKLYMGVANTMGNVNVVLFSLSICLERSDSFEPLIPILHSCLRDDQSLQGLSVLGEGKTYSSCQSFMTHCAGSVLKKGPPGDPSYFWIAELNTGEASEALAGSDTEIARRTYGLLCADEGWSYVPAPRARQLVSHYWSVRNFLWVGASEKSVVIYNDKSHEYSTRSSKFFLDWFGVLKPYYSTKFHVAGLDHGVLYSVEGAILLKLSSECLIGEIKGVVGTTKTGDSSVEFSMADLFRGVLHSMSLRVFNYLLEVRHIGISELGSLDQFILDRFGVTKTINDVERYSEMIDGQLENLVSLRLNLIVIALTVVTALLAVLALIHWT